MHNAHFCFTQVTQKRLCLSYLCLPFTQAIRVDILCIKKTIKSDVVERPERMFH